MLVISKSGQKQIFEKIKYGLFITLESHGEAIGIWDSNFTKPYRVINKLLEEFNNKGIQISKTETVKVLSTEENRTKMLEALLNQGFRNVTFVAKSMDSEFIYHTDTHKIKVKKSQPQKIKVLIVDDSKTMRKILENLLTSDPNIEIIESLETAEQAEEFLKSNSPDVITLDINLPGMSGVDFLKKHKTKLKIPTVLITSLNINDGSKVFEGLEAGAVDYIQKPDFDKMTHESDMIVEKIKTAAKVKVADAIYSNISNKKHLRFNQNTLIAIGSSTGGTNAIKNILELLPAEIPPILVVQHIPAAFSNSFAKRLDQLFPFTVKEANDGELIKKNTVYIAPGGIHMKIKKSPLGFKVHLEDGELVNRFKPSVDVMFDSIVQYYNKEVIGVVLTGMGRDGAQGLLNLKNAGARTIIQNEESCVVYGMPKAACDLGAAEHEVHLKEIPKLLESLSHKPKQLSAKVS